MQVPEEYKGREQSLLKHRVLHEYLLRWGHKLGSAAQRRHVRLCYVDGFAGPWKSKSVSLEDTSIAIGLRTLEAAAKTWSERGAKIDVEAAFVEKDPTAFAELDRFLKARTGSVRTVAHHGEFGTLVPELQKWLGGDAGLIFVDPTGWKGAAMHFIAPLVAAYPRRDVLVNVMFDHINRFKDDPRTFLRDQMREFFGLGAGDLPAALAEQELFTLYRTKLKELCGVQYAADLAIPHPTDNRTKFRLVVGGKNPAVLELFRDIEKKVIGAEARDSARSSQRRRQLTRTTTGGSNAEPALQSMAVRLAHSCLGFKPLGVEATDDDRNELSPQPPILPDFLRGGGAHASLLRARGALNARRPRRSFWFGSAPRARSNSTNGAGSMPAVPPAPVEEDAR